MANKRLNATITIGGAISGSLRNAISTTNSSLNRLGTTVKKLSNEHKLLGNAIDTFRRQGKDVDGMVQRYGRITEQLNKAKHAAEQLNRIERARQANLDKRSQIRGQFFDTLAIGAVVGTPIKTAVDFENAMLGVAKQLDGARDKAGNLTPVYYEMGRAIQQLGREIPTPTNALAEMVTAGLRMGVAKDEVLQFVRETSKMATAFEMPEGELADSMGKIAKLYKIPIPAIGGLADTINYLDDNAISKGGDIIGYLSRVGGIAASVKVTDKNMAALGSTLLTLGERTETAATATNAIIQKFAGAEMGSNKFIGTMEELGLNVTDIAKGMQKDALGTIEKVMAAIAKKPKYQQVGFLTNLVGLEHSDTFAKLANNLGELRHQMELANSEQAKGSMDREYQARLKTTSAAWEITKNRISETAVTIGSALLPALNDLMKTVGPVVSTFAEWSKEHPVLTKVIIGTAAGLVGLRLAALAFGFGLTFVKGAVLSTIGLFLRLRAGGIMAAAGTTKASLGVRALGGAFKFVTGAIKLLGRAFLLNPIGLAVTAIAGTALLIYENWDKVGPWFNSMWETIKGYFSAAKTWIGGLIDKWNPVEKIRTAWEPVAQFFTGLWDRITSGFKTAMGTITSGIDWVVGKYEGAKSALGLGPEPSRGPAPVSALPPGPSPDLPSVRARAGGTTVNDNSTSNVVVHAAPGMSPEQVADQVVKKLTNEKRRKSGASLTDGAYAQ